MKTTVLYCAAEVISQSKWIWFYRRPQRLSDVELYDQASRGPWGALSMLWRVRWKFVFTFDQVKRRLIFVRDLSSLAALVVLYSLAIDPFAQQLTHFRPERAVVDSEASIPIQSLFGGDDYLFDVKSAVKSAFVGSSIPETVSHCPSGNCSWTLYQSLAVCHQCVDISDQIHIMDTCFYQKTAGCAAYLKSGLTIELGDISNSSDATRMKTNSTGPLLKIDDVSPSLLKFTKLYHDPAGLSIKPECFYREQSFIAQCLEDIRSTLTATECSLYWCINYYSATQESGVLKESIIDSWWSHSGTDLVSVRAPLVEDGPLVNLGFHIQLLPSKDELNISDNGKNFGHDDSDHAQRHQRPAKYDPCYVDPRTNDNLAQWLVRFFNKEITSMNASRVNSQDYETDDVAIILSGQNKWPSGGRSGLPQPDPVFDIFSNVALGLTQLIRRDRQSLPRGWGPDNYLVEVGGERHTLNFAAIGTAIEDRTVVQVRWGWLCFPVGLVFMTCGLTIATKIRSSRQHIPVWGSSITALMIRGPYSYTKDTSSLLLSADQMHKKAKSTKVTLERDASGSWKLVERRDPAIGPEALDLESAESFLPQPTTRELIEYSNPAGASATTTTGSLLAASGIGRGEATVAAWSSQQRPTLTRSQSI
ncbi:MAG: hypothetical protein Q9172_002721 [Xanthocarpia lactea]